MKEKKQNEELQSRREFFKDAAKKALPIIGAIALAGSPIIARATEPMNCRYEACVGGCHNGCSGTCKGSCETTCHNSCRDTCKGSCSGTCHNSSKR